MNKYEGLDKEEGGPYKRLIVNNLHRVKIEDYICYYKLIIERCNIRDTQGDITFSEFKSEKGRSVYWFADWVLRNNYEEDKKILRPGEIYFDIPYLLRAQNKYNRQGYGSYYGIRGTYYGETDNYGFVGIVIDSVKKVQKSIKRMIIPSYIKVDCGLNKGEKGYRIIDKRSRGTGYWVPYEDGMTKDKVAEIYCKKKGIKVEYEYY